MQYLYRVLFLLVTTCLSSIAFAAEGDEMYYKDSSGVVFKFTVTSEEEKTVSVDLANKDPETGEYVTNLDEITELSIPSQYQGYNVTSTSYASFQGLPELRKLVLPEGIRKLEDGTFRFLQNLTELTLPSTLEEIGGGCFNYLPSLTEIILPQSLLLIRNGCFTNCLALESVTIPENANMENRDGEIFYNCLNLKRVVFNCKDAVNFLYNSEFRKTVEEIHFGKTFESIQIYDEIGPVACEKLRSITVDPDNPLWDSRDNCNALIRREDNRLVYGSNTTIIPGSVKSIGTAAFEFRQLPENFVVPENVEKIGGYAFHKTPIKTITIAGKTTFGNNVFEGCQQLESFNLQAEGCRFPLDNVFNDCPSLKSIDFPAHTIFGQSGYGEYGTIQFGECNIESLSFGIGCKIAIGSLKKLKSIKIADSPWHYDEEYGHYVQDDPYSLYVSKSDYYCPNLTEVELGEGGRISFTGSETDGNQILMIPKGCFIISCGNIKEVIIPEEFAGFGEGAFSSNDYLEEIVIPESCLSIPESCFHGCRKLKEINIPSKVTDIGDMAFEGCTSLERLTIPASIINIGTDIINECTNLKTVYSYIQEPFSTSWKLYTQYIWGYPSPTFEYPDTLYVPYGTKALYEQYEDWNKFGRIIEMDPSGINQTLKDESKKPVIYSLSGQRLSNPRKGINIINGRKVFIE